MTLALADQGPVATWLVEPKSATWGVCRAAATCISPESLVMKASHSPMRAMAVMSRVRPARSMSPAFFPARRRISAVVGRSAALPKRRKRASGIVLASITASSA